MVNINSIWETQKPTGDTFIKTRIDEIPHIKCYAATNHVTGQHLFMMSVSKKVQIPELKNYRFKGVDIFSIETDNDFELYIYLLDIDLKDIFSLFIQNILEDIYASVTENEALLTISNVILKWKKLFDKINFDGLTLEYQKGLIGELIFINTLIDSGYPIDKILNAWTGPDQDDKDFRFGNIGVEIKLTSSKQPRIKITNEGQLDNQNLGELFLILYAVEEVKENGYSLNSLIYQIREKLNKDNHALNFFNDRLLLLNYFKEDEEHYNRMYSIKQILSYTITKEFPKIIKSQLPFGVYNTSYSIEISSAETFRVENETITNLINGKSTY